MKKTGIRKSKTKVRAKNKAKTKTIKPSESEITDEDVETNDGQFVSVFTPEEIRKLAMDLDGGGVPVFIDSLEANIGFGSLIREFNRSYHERIAYYRSSQGGSLSPDEARACAYHPPENKEEADALYSKLSRYSVTDIDFADLGELWAAYPSAGQLFWQRMKSHAREEFESGHLASKAIVPVEYMRTAWNVACYIGMRESFIDDWKPKGAIEISMIDTMTQAFFMYQHWIKQSVLTTQTRPREMHPEYEKWAGYRKEMGWLDGYWYKPYVSEHAAQEFAAKEADRWHRIYMRTIRNLRDLRRYSVPVTINNPQQVNIAADGGQQVNVVKED